MTSRGALLKGRWWSHETTRSSLVIVIVVLVANFAFTVLGNASGPLWWTTNVSSHVCNWYCGIPTLDPNVGYITQPLGHLSALDLLHGHLPWWNYFEGVGQPLAGEMQSAALFPLVLLFALPSGLLLFHLALQTIAGITSYLLCRRLGVAPLLATAGGILFALNGTYAWVGNAAINPICFLPMLLWGIEVCVAQSRTSRYRGLTVCALAVALSIYAGFPEVAYLDGLFALGWAVVRTGSVARLQRPAAIGRLAVASALGTLISLPVLVPFLDFATVADLGDHASHALATTTTPPSALTLLVDPYAGGALFGGTPSTPSNLIGYFSASVTVFALVGLWGRRHRPLRWFLATWLGAVVAGSLNLLEVRRLWNLLPLMNEVAFARYVWPSAELAAIVLALLGLSDLVDGTASTLLARRSLVVVFSIALCAVLVLSPFAGHERGSLKVALVVMIALPFIVMALLGYSVAFLEGRTLLRVMLAVMTLESVTYFAVPTFRTPTSVTVANGSIDYLHQHEGLQRFLSLGVLNPNWGSQFSLNEINAIDLPLPKDFSLFIATKLAPSDPDPRIFVQPFTTTNQDEVAAHLANYEALGVAYVLTPPLALDPNLSDKGLTLVAHDARSNLYQLPQPTNFYATGLSTCVISHASVDRVDVTCPAGTSLTRLELSMAGWSAHVNGASTPITSSEALTQSVAIPAGSSTVTFDFLPPHEDAAALVALLALLALAGTWLPHGRRRDDSDVGEPTQKDVLEPPSPVGVDHDRD